MPLMLGIDLGTSKTTAVAVDPESGAVVSAARTATGHNKDADCQQGRSQWNASGMVADSFDLLARMLGETSGQSQEILSLGVTGQQHGMMLIDSEGAAASPLINWQDQRGNERRPGQDRTWVDAARAHVGEAAAQRAGCRLSTGFMATTLFWLSEQGELPEDAGACFLMDWFVSRLTGRRPVTDPTLAGSAGVFDVAMRRWDPLAIEALGLSLAIFPEVREADEPAGVVSDEAAQRTGLPQGLPVAVPIGDHQASFLGSVSDLRRGVLLNVGTGAQAAVFTDGNEFAPPIELRPFPVAGNLLSNVGLAGGWSYQVVESFVRQLVAGVTGAAPETPVYEQLGRLAAAAEPDCGGLICVPTFSGTRADPHQTGSLLGATPENLTPANFARAVLNGMAANYREAWEQITAVTGRTGPPAVLAGAGNGIRDNAVLAAAVADQFKAAPSFTQHREEAAYGAALMGAVAAGVFDSLEEASQLVQYE